jgi:hypothetical protein
VQPDWQLSTDKVYHHSDKVCLGVTVSHDRDICGLTGGKFFHEAGGGMKLTVLMLLA